MKTIDTLYEEWLSLQPMKDADKKRLEQKFMLEFNYNSSHIEGNTLTYGQTKLLLLFGQVVDAANMRDLEEMKAHVQSLVERLELPWHILRLCGGDMSFTAALCFDFEVYSEAQKRWLEVSSVSNFDNYQANRLKCRYRDENKKTQLCHTLNGSALALPRIVAALLENNQTPEGIRIPKALVPYTGFDMIK